MLVLSRKVECCDIARAVNVLEVYYDGADDIFFLGFNRRVASTDYTTTRHLFF